MSSSRVYLNVSYEEKYEAKKLGALWSHQEKKWFAPSLEIAVRCMRWLPDHLKAPHGEKEPQKKPRENMRRPPGGFVTGANYVETKCECGLQPWECECFSVLYPAEFAAFCSV